MTATMSTQPQPQPQQAVAVDADPDGDGFHPARWLTLALVVVAIVIVEIATWFLLRSQGYLITGDSPHYLIAGETLSHLSVHVLPQFQSDLASHYIFAWPQGATLQTMGAHVFYGPHGAIFAQGIGVPVLLAPFIALGGVPLALVGFFTVNAIGFVFIHQRGSALADLGRNGQLVFALALACPALLLAGTQIYPDLISGVFFACGLLEMARVERSGTCRWTSVTFIAIALAVPPWFQVKNFSVDVAAMLGLLALVALRRMRASRALVIIGAVIASFALLVLYNKYFFGNLLGLPQPSPDLGARGIKDTLGLVFDRDQGFLVQCPTILFGLLGLWYSRRKSGVTNLALVVGAGAILVINGSQPILGAFGGVALAGRFQWTVMPMLLAWSPFFLKRLAAYRTRLAVVGGVVAFLWVVQAVPIILAHHAFSNETFPPFAPWDPSLYPGWWDWVNSYLPSVASRTSGVVAVEALIEVVLVVGFTWLLVRLTSARPIELRRVVTVGAGAVVLVVLVAFVVPSSPAPAASLTWSGQYLGSPWKAGDSRLRTNPTPLVDVGAGTFKVTLTESVDSPSGAPSRMSFVTTPIRRILVTDWLSVRHPTSMRYMTIAPAPLDLAQEHVATLVLPPTTSTRQTTFSFSTSGAATLSFSAGVGANSTLDVTSMQLQKTSD
ncbi:MAG: hypothetical protein WAL61_06470 [Acidimicrobiales bacterium]